MDFEMLILGSGTSTGVPRIGCDCEVCRSTDPRDRRTRPSSLVCYTDTADPTRRRQILIDATPDLRQQSLRHGLRHLDAVMFTHSHADHIMGVDDLRQFNALMRSPIDVYAERATFSVLRETFKYIFNPSLNVSGSYVASLNPMPLEVEAPVDLYGATWRPLRLMHGEMPVLGFRVDFGVHALGYCSDVSEFPPQTLEQLRNLDALVIDAPRFLPHHTHQNVEQALKVIDLLKPRRAYLTHMDHDIMHSKVEPELPESVYLACDGLVIRCGT